MQRLRKILHSAIIFSMMMTLVAVAFPATVGAANLLINPTTYAFPGATEVGTTSAGLGELNGTPGGVQVFNNGNVAVTINNIDFDSGGDDFDITGNGCLGAVLLVGQGCTFDVVFEPETVGSHQAVIEIQVAGNPNSYVTVSGSGINPVVTITPNSTPAAPFDFGPVQIGETSPQQPFRITNTGDEEIQFTSAIISAGNNDFNVLNDSGLTCLLNFPLAPDAFCDVRVAFQPDAPIGPKNGALALFYVTEGGQLVTRSHSLLGTAVQASVSAAPNPADFGDQSIFAPGAPQEIVFTNTGVGPVTINDVIVGGIDAADFTLLYAGANNCYSGAANTLQIGESCSVWVRFAPTVAGLKNGVLQFVINNDPVGVFPEGNYFVQLNGTGTTGTTTLAPSFLNFGSQQVGTVSGPMQVTFTNNTGAGITVAAGSFVLNDPGPDDYEIQLNACDGAFLADGASCTFEVVFAPLSSGIHNATIENAGGATLAQVTGVGVLASISAAPNPVNFGGVEVNSPSAPIDITVTNTGTGPVEIVSATLVTGTNFFIITDTCTGQTLAANGDTCTLQAYFGPTALGPVADMLDIDYLSGGVTSTYSIALTGTGTPSNLTITEPDGTNDGVFDFGDVVVGQSAQAIFVVTNNGAANVTLPATGGVLTGDPDYTELSDTCDGATILAPGQSCSIIVNFGPSETGAAVGLLTVNPMVQLLGNGVSPNGALVVSTPQLTFGPQQVGSQSQTQQVIVTNNGNVPVTLATIATTSDDYIPTAGAGANCQVGLVLDPGVSCVLWLAFQPDGTPMGDVNGTLEITYTSLAFPGPPVGTLIVLLRGMAVSPVLEISPSQLDFGNQEVGTVSAPQTVTVKNVGPNPVTLDLDGPWSADFERVAAQCEGFTLQPGQSCTFQITFRPQSAGVQTDAVDIEVTPGALNFEIDLKGIGIDPVLVVTPAGPIDFGSVIVDGPGGIYALRTITVTNTSSNPVEVPAPQFSGTGFGPEANDCPVFPALLGPGASCTIVIYFDPQTAGPYTSTVMVNPIVILMGVGVGANGALQVSTPQLTFGPQQVGTQSQTQQVIVSNNGNVPVTLGNPAIDVPAPYVLAAGAGNTCQNNMVLDPGESCTFWVAFQPTAAGPANAALTINYSSININPGVVGVLLRGTGITPVLAINPIQLTFGPQAIGTASAAQTVTVTNSTNGPLTLGALGVNDPSFELIGDLCTNATLAPNASCTFSVVFLPTGATGPKAGLVTIPVDGLSDVTVMLSGMALAAPQGGIQFNPPFINFGFQQVLSPGTPQPVTVKNIGSVPFTVTDTFVIGTGAASFLAPIGDNCEDKSLNPGEECTIYVRFRPTTTGVIEAQLIYTTTLAGSPHSVYLYGVGITPTLEISPAQLNFGNLQVGVHSAPYTVTVRNMSSTAAVTINLDGPWGPDFELVGAGCEGATLAPLGVCTFSVVFHPDDTGLRSSAVDVEITTGGPGGLNYEVDLVGVGLSTNGMVTPLQLDFGNVQVGFTSIVQTVKYTNIGSGPITLPEVNVAGPDFAEFLIQTDSCSNATVPSGGECWLSVVFRPQTMGPKNAQLEVGPLHNPSIVTLKGFGTVPSPVFLANSVDFGTQPLNVASSPRRVTVTNNGPGILILFGAPTIVEPAPADFTILTSTCNDANLATGQSCYVDVVFKPLAPLMPDPDIRTGMLNFMTNMPTAMQSVALTGQVGQFTVTVITGASPCVTTTITPAGPYTGDAEVTATATIAAGSTFIGWYLDGYYVGFANPIDFKMNNSSHSIEAVCVASPSFSDIAGSPYKTAIEQMAAFGFIKGYFGLSGPYGPDDNVLRSQMAVILVRMANRTNAWGSEVHANPFSDQCSGSGGGCVDAESWAAVSTGYEKQVIRGLGFGIFSPFTNVTEMESVAFVTRMMQTSTLELEQHGRLPGCPIPNQGTPASPPLGILPVNGCPVPANFVSGQIASKATKWESQSNIPSVYGSVPDGSGFRRDITTYTYYAGAVPGTTGPADAWATWSSPAKRQQIAAILWNAYASYWGTDRIDELP